MNSLYQQALSLYSQGDYEGAWDLLQNTDLETEQEIRLFKECDKLVAEKAVYVLRSYIEEGKIKEAKNYKIEFLSKYGHRLALDAVEIPEEVQSSQYYTQQLANEQEQTTENQILYSNEKRTSLGKVFLVVIVIFALIFWGAYPFFLRDGYTGESSQKSFESSINSVVTEVKNDKDNKIIGETDDALYYLGVQEFVLYKYDKREAYTKTFSFEDMGMYSGVHTMFLEDDMIVLIGGNNALGMMAGSIAAFFDIRLEKFVNHFWGREIEIADNCLIVDYDEIIIDNGYSAGNEYFSFKQYFDFKGNLIDGKVVRGIGAIGKYPIEMSFHTLAGKITGWYKYKGHTNYMTIQGEIDNTDSFYFREFNDKKEAFGKFTGRAFFDQGILTGMWEMDNKQLDFYIGK